MKRKIFWYTLLVSVALLSASFYWALCSMFDQNVQRTAEGLKPEWDYVCATFDQGGVEGLKSLAYRDTTEIFLVDAQDKVQYNSTGTLRNRNPISTWTDIKEARALGEGRAVFNTGDLITEAVGYAKPLEDGSVLAVSREISSFYALGIDLLWPFFLLTVLAGILSLLVSWRITRAVTAPLMDARLEDLETQKVCVELQPLAARMLEQNRSIQKQLQKQYNEVKRGYEKQDRIRRDFTANVSHELKTPLTSISGYAEIIRDGIVQQEDIPRFAGKIHEETQRLIDLVSDILKLSQLDEGHQIRLERVSIDLYETCRRVAESLQTKADHRGITFHLAGSSQKITGAEQIIDEIVSNLCDNAIKYNKEGGQIVVSVTRREDRVALSVKDTGIGISKEEQGRVFERFYRVDKSHSKDIGGTGLGLSIVKHAAAYHDAKVELYSEPGNGTEFVILFHGEEADKK